MLRLRAFRPTNDRVVRLQLHPTESWLVTADDSDNVVLWNWEHRQVVYEVNAGGVDEKRLVGAQLKKLAGESETKGKPTEAIRGGSVKQVKFYDDDIRFWQAWLSRSAAAEAPIAVNQQSASPGATTRGRHFLVICCVNKAIFLDVVTMKGRDVPKQVLENKAPLCVEFLPRSAAGDGPFAVFGGSDGTIRVLSMSTWQMTQKYVGGHKGSITCLITFVAASGETLLVSGASDGFLVIWDGENSKTLREGAPKLSVKAHDGGVIAVEIARVIGSAPHLITIGADKTLAIWDTISFKELRRIKPVPKLACHSVASWCHPRAPSLEILTCVKDSHIWAIEHATSMALTRPLCDLSSQVPQGLVTPNKKLKAYCMVVHPLQPHLVATGTNLGVILSEFDPKSLPAAVALPALPGSKENSVVYTIEKELYLLTFQLGATSGNPADGSRLRMESVEALQGQVKQTRKRVTTVPHDSYSVLSVSNSGKYVAMIWPDISHFEIYRASDWSAVDNGQARHFAWDSCQDRYALLEAVATPKLLPIVKGGGSKKAKEAAAFAAAQAAAAAASAAASASVQVRILLEDGSPNLLCKAIQGRTEQVIGLQGGALLGVSYKLPRFEATIGDAALFGSKPNPADVPANFLLYSWETFRPISGLLPQPEWSAWDQTVEYCALAYQNYIVIAAVRPQFHYLGNVAIGSATGGIWHRRQLFIATPTTIECVFVDAGVSPIDVEARRKKEEAKIKESQANAFAEQGELALLTVDGPKVSVQQKISLRPPMLQVVRLASFHATPSIPPFLSTGKQSKQEESTTKDIEERRPNDTAIAAGGIAVAVSRLPLEQKRPVGPLVVVGVRDGVLWLIDRYMTAHAIGLSHPGIRCRCLAAYGDAVSSVKWASRLGREHHDDLAQFLLGMGYATEALHLPGISKRLEFDLAMQSGNLKRALQCLLVLSNSKAIGQETGLPTDFPVATMASLNAKKNEAVDGIVKFAKEFIDLVDAADATGQADIAGEALKKLAAAGSVEGALQPHVLRGLSLRLANHGELTRLAVLVNTMISADQAAEAALAAALLGDSALMEKAWQESKMFPQAALHAHAHGRQSLKVILEQWNRLLQQEHQFHAKPLPKQTGAVPEKDIMHNLTESAKPPPIQVVPPGNVALGSGVSLLSLQKGSTVQKQPLALPAPGQPLALPAPGQPLALPAPGQPLDLPAPGQPLALPASGQPLPAPGHSLAMLAPGPQATVQLSAPMQLVAEPLIGTMQQMAQPPGQQPAIPVIEGPLLVI